MKLCFSVHFYEDYQCHLPMYGLGLPDAVLKKLYRENALRVFQQARDNAA
jgi:hypothetical protein